MLVAGVVTTAQATDFRKNYICNENSAEPMFVNFNYNGSVLSQRYLGTDKKYDLYFGQYLGTYNNLYRGSWEAIVTFHYTDSFTIREKGGSVDSVSYCRAL